MPVTPPPENEGERRPLTVLVGGVGQLYQGDLDLGRRAAARLEAARLGAHVLVEELHYGAVAVAQRLEDLRPDALVLVGAVQRGRTPGTVERRRITGRSPSSEAVQQAVTHAVTGYVDVDLVVDVAHAFDALPARTVVVEVEPACTDPGDRLSPEGDAGLEEAIRMVRAEVQVVPVLDLADQLRGRVGEQELAPSVALDVLCELLDALDQLDRSGHFGRVHLLRDRLRRRMTAGDTGAGMEPLDWSLWWALVEELDRLQALDVE